MLAACGGSVDEPQRTAEEGGLATYEVEEFGFSVGVPSDWRALSADEAVTDEMVESVREVEAIEAPDSPVKFVGVDSQLDDGFATTLNVVVDEPPGGATREDY